MKRIVNLLLFAVTLSSALLLSDLAQAHLQNASNAFDRISALAGR